ncbi:hypothetical protein ACVINZ_000174 [Mesorhizobium jarvisii]
MKTSDLISSLAKDLPPVRRLRPPSVRAGCWLVLATVVLILVGVAQGLRPDLIQRLSDPAFVASIVASLLTGALAAVSAFFVSLPDRSRLWLFLPLPALGVWLSNIGYQCLTQWISIGPDGVGLGEAVRCFATLVLTSLPLSFVMLVMLRHAAALRPRTVAVMGSLSVAAITATALSLFHALDATVMILIWNFGTAVILVALGGVFSKRMFRWVAPRAIAASD